jgi:predicted transcriptional regulator
MGMSTSVKLDEEDKEKLERLQALVTLKAGGKVTQQELLSMLIREALARSDEFVEKIFKTSIPMPDQEYEKILSLVEDWGVETNWKEIDQTLYGAKRRD